MLKKFIIKDEEGKPFEVTEASDEEIVEAEKHDEEPFAEKTEELFASEEIAALKELAKHSEELIKLLAVEKKEHEAVSEAADGCEEAEDAEETEDAEPSEEKKEEVIDVKSADSKASVGAIEKKAINKVDDSFDKETEISNAWSNRFKKSFKKGE